MPEAEKMLAAKELQEYLQPDQVKLRPRMGAVILGRQDKPKSLETRSLGSDNRALIEVRMFAAAVFPEIVYRTS